MDLANQAFRKSDIPGCMVALDDAESKLENRSELHNLRGSCFVELRDFGKAREAFQMADQMSPGNPSIAFNLAEMDFLTGEWQDAISRFQVVAEKFAGKENGIGELAEFKIMLCHSKLGQIVQMESVLEKLRKTPQSPASYYSEAAATLLKGDIPGFENWCAKAMEAFPDRKVLAPWQDTLDEFLLAPKP